MMVCVTLGNIMQDMFRTETLLSLRKLGTEMRIESVSWGQHATERSHVMGTLTSKQAESIVPV